MTDPTFRERFARVAAWIDDFLTDTRRYRVLSQAQPGDLIAALPAAPPLEGEAFETIFTDFERHVVPGLTHWNHPRFFAYFAISSAPVAVLAEALAATLDVNAMLWRTSPAATELEDVTLGWLRQMLGLPDAFHGIIYDTASISGFTALAAARESLGLDIRNRGMTGRDLPALRVYITEHTHSHIEKGAIALGIGRDNVVKIPVDDAFRMRADALAAAIDEDLACGRRPMCIAATVGTTSTTSSDPVEAIAAIARERNVWLHVDASYAGPAAILPEFRYLLDPAHAADSLVVNPHKWLFIPIDLSVLYIKDTELFLRRTFSLVADYLVTPETNVRNYMDYGLQLGRRFRALKLWFAIREYGVRGLQERLRAHIALAQEFAGWIEAEPEWEIVAPHPLSVVCYRYAPAGLNGDALDALNDAVLTAVNDDGRIMISSTKLHGRTVLRLAIGNERTTRDDVVLAWEIIRASAASLATAAP